MSLLRMPVQVHRILLPKTLDSCLRWSSCLTALTAQSSMQSTQVDIGFVYPLAAPSWTGLPWGVRRYASAQASFRASNEVGSAKPLAVTKCSRAASQ
jgi:hypothetical protein